VHDNTPSSAECVNVLHTQAHHKVQGKNGHILWQQQMQSLFRVSSAATVTMAVNYAWQLPIRSLRWVLWYKVTTLNMLLLRVLLQGVNRWGSHKWEESTT